MALEEKNNFSPVSPIYIEDKPALEIDMSVISYNSKTSQVKQLSSVDDLLGFETGSGVTWINICGLMDTASVRYLGELYNVHQLTIEDILHTEQQPKYEMFEKYRFFSAKTIQQEKRFQHKHADQGKTGKNSKSKTVVNNDIEEFVVNQVSMIITKNIVITFQETPDSLLDGVRNRILNKKDEIHKKGTDYLAYTIVDAIVDGYSVILNHLEDDIENIEDRATKTNDSSFIQEIQSTKKNLLHFRRAILPLRDNILAIIRRRDFLLTDDLKPFLQDLSENINHAIIKVENYREWLTNIMEVNLSVVSYQLNKVMKVLATISTIFIPLTFIAGVYGMNFQHMPELEYEFAYPIVLVGMAIVAISMITIFKIRRWF